MSGSIQEFTDGNWKAEVLDSPIPVVVDFWAPWCGPCRQLAPTIEKLAGLYEGKVKVGKMNTDENQDTPGSLRISAIPTVLVFHKAKWSTTWSASTPRTNSRRPWTDSESCEPRVPSQRQATLSDFQAFVSLARIAKARSCVEFRGPHQDLRFDMCR